MPIRAPSPPVLAALTALAAVLVWMFAAAPSAEAVTRQRADQVATRVTARLPEGDLYRLAPRALKATDVVTFATLTRRPVGTRGFPPLGTRPWVYRLD